MSPSSKPIALTNHARHQMQARSVTEAEVTEVVRFPESLHLGKRGAVRAVKVFHFGKRHRGTPYRFKKVEVRYVEEPTEIVVLTVISKFFD